MTIDTKALREAHENQPSEWRAFISTAELRALLDAADELDRVKAEGDSAAWLLEWPANEAYPLRWWQGDQLYTYDVHKAVRFVRREDAEVVKRTLKLSAQPVAHMWIGDRALAAKSALAIVLRERDEAQEAIALLLATPEISDTDPRDKDEETHAAERKARAALSPKETT